MEMLKVSDIPYALVFTGSTSLSVFWYVPFSITDITGCSEYASVCYNLGKYAEAISWCDHVLDMATAGHPTVFRVKSCKGKALAQVYLHKQLKRLQRSDQWTMLGYDGNSELAETIILTSLSSHPSAIDNELLIQLCFADLKTGRVYAHKDNRPSNY